MEENAAVTLARKCLRAGTAEQCYECSLETYNECADTANSVSFSPLPAHGVNRWSSHRALIKRALLAFVALDDCNGGVLYY